MARFSGSIGYVITQRDEKRPDVYIPKTVEKHYKGDIKSINYRWQNQNDSTNDDISINNEISIIADDFAKQNLGFMKYVTWMGNKWKINSAKVNHPRINLTIGGLYNG